ncbi:hypothetical protein COY27_01510 [Candidatus Woesearchaeota archaeon CG_4_10_14_0_2_um_filter_33_13]|nr:MAG: hypothetical protein COY27_01510 [Candidatus Woesearchaeota archaeon CG_4_10_14_0_2_um_filter_33_13]
MVRKVFIQNVSSPYFGTLGMRKKEDCVALSANIMAENGYQSIIVAIDVLKLGNLKHPKEKNTIPEVKIYNFKRVLNYFMFARKYNSATFFGNARTIVGLTTCFFGEYRIFMSHTCNLPTHWLERKILSFFLKRFDAIKVESYAEKRLLEKLGINSHRIFVIPIPIDFDYFSQKPNSNLLKELKSKYFIAKDEVILIFLAALREQKRADTVLKAIKVLKDRGIKVKLLQVGQDLLKERLGKSFVELATEIGVKENIICAGRVKDEELRALIHLSQIGIQSSEVEGQCIVAFEFAAAGIPECLSNIPSFEVFGGNVLRHNPSDYQKLAFNIEFYLNNPNIAKKHVNENKRLVQEKYDYETVKLEMKKLLINKKECLKRKKRWFK